MRNTFLFKALLGLVVTLALTGQRASAQRFSVSTNAVDWMAIGTINAEAGVAFQRHFSAFAGARVNPWTFRQSQPDDRFDDPLGDEERQFQDKKQAYYAGVRYWPWYIYSGWWFGLKGQYMEYDRGGFIVHQREAGDAWGAGLAAGYTYMLNEYFNIDFGAGVWGGQTNYGTYRCTNCGQPMETGKKWFVLPDYVSVSLMFIF